MLTRGEGVDRSVHGRRWTTRQQDAARRWYENRTDLSVPDLVAHGAERGLWPAVSSDRFRRHVAASRARAERRGERPGRRRSPRPAPRYDAVRCVRFLRAHYGDMSRPIMALAVELGFPDDRALVTWARRARQAGFDIPFRRPPRAA